MNGQAKTLEERGVPEHSYFEVVFADGTLLQEHYANWSDFSEERRVRYFGGIKTVMVSVRPIARIRAWHDGMDSEIDVPEGYEAYQAIRGMANVSMDGGVKNEVIGRVIGLVKDGEVVEERFIDGVSRVIHGNRI